MERDIRIEVRRKAPRGYVSASGWTRWEALAPLPARMDASRAEEIAKHHLRVPDRQARVVVTFQQES